VNINVLLTKSIALELLYYRLILAMPKIKRNIYNQLVPIPILVVNDLVFVIVLSPLLQISRTISRSRRPASSVSSPSPALPKILLLLPAPWPLRPRPPPMRLPTPL
jgi:hypothetical protein